MLPPNKLYTSLSFFWPYGRHRRFGSKKHSGDCTMLPDGSDDGYNCYSSSASDGDGGSCYSSASDEVDDENYSDQEMMVSSSTTSTAFHDLNNDHDNTPAAAATRVLLDLGPTCCQNIGTIREALRLVVTQNNPWSEPSVARLLTSSPQSVPLTMGGTLWNGTLTSCPNSWQPLISPISIGNGWHGALTFLNLVSVVLNN
jgi:hypothetical protein